MKSKKVLVIGMDGADWRYINYGLKNNKLPTIKRLMQSGSYGKLKSVIPPYTFPAWLCFCSGKNPGTIGFYGYLKKKKNSYDTEIIDSYAFNKITPFWHNLNKQKIKTGIVNIPLTFNPVKTDEFMICLADMDYVPKDGHRCYPKELDNYITKKLGKLDYETNYSYFNRPPEEQIKESIKYLKNRSKLNKLLIEKHKNLDLFLTIFFPDRLQHFIVDPDQLMKYYSELDNEIDNLIKQFKPDDVLLISDHGGGKVKKDFHVNEFLIRQGFLKLKKKKSAFLNRIGINLENIQKLLAKLKIDSKVIKLLPRRVIYLIKPAIPNKVTSIKDAEIDWNKTLAYALTDSGIFINLKGRDPEGIVDEKDYEKIVKKISEKLKEIKDPFTNKNIDVDIYTKEELYKVDKMEDATDIIYSFGNWDYIPKLSLVGEIFRDPRDLGNHKLYGMIIANGKNIKKGEIKGGNLIDIAPTILSSFGVTVPKDMDGKALDIFNTSRNLK
jgi:predicted AlkP superfamily phosphohydrolase/phosphomutase